MYNLENASLIENHRRQDEIKSAEKHRLIKQITKGRSPENKWHGRLLTKLGTKMVTWGFRMTHLLSKLLV